MSVEAHVFLANAEISLKQAVQIALEENRALTASRLDLTLTQIDLDLALQERKPHMIVSSQVVRDAVGGQTGQVTFAPSLNLATGATVQAVITKPLLGSNFVSGDASAKAVSIAISIVQPLLKGNFSVAGIALKTAKLSDSISRLQHESLLENTVASVVLAYFNAVQADVQVKVARQALQRGFDTKSNNQALVDVGRLAKMELLQAEVDVAQSELAVSQAINAAEDARRALLRLLGVSGANLAVETLKLDDSLPEVDDLPGLDAALNNAIFFRPDLKIARLSVQTVELALKLAENALLPQLDFIVSSSYSKISANVSTRPGDHSVALTFNAPWDRSSAYAQRSRAKASLTRAQWALDDLQSEIKVDVSANLKNLEFARRQINLSKLARDLSKKRLESEIEKMRVGRTSSFQLSSAQDALKNAEIAVADAVFAQVRLQLQLQLTMGQILQKWAVGFEPLEVKTESK